MGKIKWSYMNAKPKTKYHSSNLLHKLNFIENALEMPLELWQKKVLLMFWQHEKREDKRKGVDFFEKKY